MKANIVARFNNTRCGKFRSNNSNNIFIIYSSFTDSTDNKGHTWQNFALKNLFQCVAIFDLFSFFFSFISWKGNEYKNVNTF